MNASGRKKVAYITRHAISNYGSVLQAYATQTALEQLGYDAVCINYYRTDEKIENHVNTRLGGTNSKWNRNPLTRLVFKVTQKPVYAYAEKRFEKYRRLIKMTDREYGSESELAENPPEADIYMTGSDQVWNGVLCGEVDPVYFLSFLKGNEKRIAYAASFGGAEVKDKDKPMMSELLKKYDFVTVREDSGVGIAKELGVDAERVLDPTLLLTASQWERLIPKRECNEKYVLVYQLHPNKAFVRYAADFAKAKGMKLYRISHCFHHAVRTGKFICCPPPEEFLRYIKNAEYFLTDSFHGTAFAIGLNTQFANCLPGKYSERISSILRLIGYEDRIISRFDDFGITDKKIDYSSVNKIIAGEREKSFDILRKMLGD